MNHAGGFYADLIGLADESAATASREFKPPPAETAELLIRQMANGRRIAPRPTLAEARDYLARTLGQPNSAIRISSVRRLSSAPYGGIERDAHQREAARRAPPGINKFEI